MASSYVNMTHSISDCLNFEHHAFKIPSPLNLIEYVK